MFKEKFKNIKSMIIKNEEGVDKKKKIENIVVFLIILIITIIAINTIWKTDSKTENNNEQESDKTLALANQIETDIDTKNNEYKLEENLENILQKIYGAGKVNVLITYSESSQIVAMYNENSKESTTEETDSGGGTRKINELDTEKDIVYKEENGVKVPITQKLVMPKIEGAIVIAEGAASSEVKMNIIQAVEAATRACNT